LQVETAGPSERRKSISFSPQPETTAFRQPLSAIQESRRPPPAQPTEKPSQPPRPTQKLKHKYGALGVDRDELPRAVATADAYVPPRHPGMVGDGSRLAALEVWHKSLETGVDVSPL
jgi:hypothetical protein